MVDDIKHMGVGNDVGRREMAALAKAGQRRRRHIMTAATKRPSSGSQHQPPCHAPCTRTKVAMSPVNEYAVGEYQQMAQNETSEFKMYTFPAVR